MSRQDIASIVQPKDHPEKIGVRITPPPGIHIPAAPAETPAYLRKHYWWAYVHPAAVRFFERPWLINLILLGNYRRLSEAALEAMGTKIAGRCLQLACVYGDLTPRLCERLAEGASLDVVEVLPVQLENLRRKLGNHPQVQLRQEDSSALPMADASYDQALLFFLLHEQPAEVRRRTLEEAFRVVKASGQIVIVDYAKPCWWNPIRYLLLPILGRIEPFAPDLWRKGIIGLLPKTALHQKIQSRSVFGGLYQQVTITR